MLHKEDMQKTPARGDAETDLVVLVVGPRIPEALLRRHCVAALHAGYRVALVPLRPVSVGERYILRALARWYGQSRIRVIENHEDWVVVPDRRRLVVLSERGLGRDDERVADRDAMLAMPSPAVFALY